MLVHIGHNAFREYLSTRSRVRKTDSHPLVDLSENQLHETSEFPLIDNSPRVFYRKSQKPAARLNILV